MGKWHILSGRLQVGAEAGQSSDLADGCGQERGGNCRHRFSVDLGNKATLGREEGTKTGNQLSSQSRVMARVRQ